MLRRSWRGLNRSSDRDPENANARQYIVQHLISDPHASSVQTAAAGFLTKRGVPQGNRNDTAQCRTCQTRRQSLGYHDAYAAGEAAHQGCVGERSTWNVDLEFLVHRTWVLILGVAVRAAPQRNVTFCNNRLAHTHTHTHTHTHSLALTCKHKQTHIDDALSLLQGPNRLRRVTFCHISIRWRAVITSQAAPSATSLVDLEPSISAR